MPKAITLILLAIMAIALSVFTMKSGKANGDEHMVNIYNAETGKIEKVELINKTDAEWSKILTPEQFIVMRQKGTERAFSSSCSLPQKGEEGIFKCAGCGTDLFKVGTKFESGTGWPSFWEPVSDLNIKLVDDNSLGMVRTEVLCARCGAHLGHVFNDGPPPTNKRFCMNNIALVLSVKKHTDKLEKATFATGCFWGSEAAFRKLLGKGVISTQVGYTGGDYPNPKYEDLHTKKTGHHEAVEVTFDPEKISYSELLKVFWSLHNPLRTDGQGPDIGEQYRAAVFYHTQEQQTLAEKSKQELEKTNGFKGHIATLILPAKTFYPAEEYHQRYYEKKGVDSVCPIY